MSKLLEWALYYIGDEPIEAVQIGEMGGSGYNEPPGLPSDYKDKIGKVMTLEEAMPYLTYYFDTGYGSPNCTAVLIFTKSWIVSVSQYDGRTAPFVVARNPMPGFVPTMPGG